MMVRKLINNRSWIVATGLIRNAMSGGLGIPCTNTVTELLYCWIELRFNRRGAWEVLRSEANLEQNGVATGDNLT